MYKKDLSPLIDVSFPEGKGGTHTVIIGHGGRRFLQLAQSRIRDEKGFVGPFLWRVSSKGPASMHEDASDLPLLPSAPLLPSIHGPPFSLSSTYRFFHPSNPAPLTDHARPSFALWTRILLCLRFLFFFPSVTLLGVWSRSENFFTTLVDDTWVIDVWPDSSALIFYGFLIHCWLIYFDWWIYFFFFFFFWEERERINWIGSYFRLYNDGRNIAFEKVIIFILLVDNFLTIWNDILKKIRFSFEIFK